eukprot:gene9879-10037_t
MVVPDVVEFMWQPTVTVDPQALSLGVGETATLSYTVDVRRIELPAKALLQGSLRIVNPLTTPTQLVQVAVEAMSTGQQSWGLAAADCSQQGSTGNFPAGSPANRTAVTVPAKGSVACGFSMDYPKDAPDQGAVTAWAVTKAGQLLQASEGRFSVKRMQQQGLVTEEHQPQQPVKLGGCATFSDTFLGAGESPTVVVPSVVPAKGQKAPEAVSASAHGRADVGGEVLCGNATFNYSAVLGPFGDGQCGKFRSLRAGFLVQYKRTAMPPVKILSGLVTLHNPNLLQAIHLVSVQVEVLRAGAAADAGAQQAVLRGWAACPRDAQSGAVLVTGQLSGTGSLECSWSISIPASAGAGDELLQPGSGATLVAVAVTQSGMEAASTPQLLSAVPAAAPASGRGATASAGACAAVADSFQAAGLDGQRLLLPSSAKAGADRLLPGDSGGGRGLDIVCDSLSLSYGAAFGPLSKNQCGQHQATNVAVVSPTSGTIPAASASSTISISVTGCPGVAATLKVANLQLQLIRSTPWRVVAQSNVAEGDVLQASVGKTSKIAFNMRYIAQEPALDKQVTGSVLVQSIGLSPLPVSQVAVDVVAVDAAAGPQVFTATWAAHCPANGTFARVPSRSNLSCSFTGPVPETLGRAHIVARLQLPDGTEFASPAAVLDITQQPQHIIDKGQCVMAVDGFVRGNQDQVVPSSSSRPASAAAPVKICSSQSVSFVVGVGPFTAPQCGKMLTWEKMALMTAVHTYTPPSCIVHMAAASIKDKQGDRPIKLEVFNGWVFKSGTQSPLGGSQRLPSRLLVSSTTHRALPVAVETLDVPLLKHFQEEIVVEGLLHVTPVQAGSCLWERFGSLDQQLSPFGLEGAPSLRSALNDSDGNQTLTEAICLATPADAPEEQSSILRQSTSFANTANARTPTALQANTPSASQMLTYQRATVMDMYTAEVLQASAAVRRRRRRALVKALRAGKRSTQVLLQKPVEALSSLVSWDEL